MPITAIEIRGFRGFAKGTRLQVAIPTGSPGSGLTVLVGPNGSGKSTIVEAFGHLSGRQTDEELDGSYTDKIQGGGSEFTYQVCEAGTSICSNTATAVF